MGPYSFKETKGDLGLGPGRLRWSASEELKHKVHKSGVSIRRAFLDPLGGLGGELWSSV